MTVLVPIANFAHNTDMPLKLYELVGTDAIPPVQPVLLADAHGAGA